MKYIVIHVSNGHFQPFTEWSDKNSAVVEFHRVCSGLWNAPDVEKACVKLLNENLQEEKSEYIKYDE